VRICPRVPIVVVVTVTEEGACVISRDGLPDPQAATSRTASAAAGHPATGRNGLL